MIVIFHSSDGQNHCDDGFAAAWVFKQKYPDAHFMPGVYGTSPPLDEFVGEHVVLADFSYKRRDMEAVIETAAMVTVLDHHETAESELAGLQEAHPEVDEHTGMSLVLIKFDMARSGARMAWDYCFSGEEPPDLILRIEDNDLWRTPRRYEDSTLVQAALRSHPQDFATWDRLMAAPVRDLVADGTAIRRFLDQKVDELKRTAWRAEVGGVEMPVCNAPWFLASDLAGALAEDDEGGRAAVYFDQDKRRVYSLRARRDAEVSSIAQLYGGGGHRGAAGFEVPKV